MKKILQAPLWWGEEDIISKVTKERQQNLYCKTCIFKDNGLIYLKKISEPFIQQEFYIQQT